jgi:uncharacterized repeat protein (TIGR03803 family)
VTISSSSTATIDLGNFFDFNAQHNFRTFLPEFTGQSADFIWDSFPDTSLGGVVTGATQTNLGKLFIKSFHGQAQLPATSPIYSVVASVPNNSSLGGSLNGAVLASDGNLYGTLPYNGDYYSGAIFQATPAGAFNLVYSFSGQADGGSPSSLVAGSDGRLYGTTAYGGAHGHGTVFALSTGGSFITIYNFGGQDDGSIYGGNPLLVGRDGNLYGDSGQGGDNGNGEIFQFIVSSGAVGSSVTYNELASLPGSNTQNPNNYNGGSGAGALLQDAQGNFYGVSQFGGTNGAGSVFQYQSNANGGDFQTYSFQQLYDYYGNPVTPGLNTLVEGNNGVFYGTAQYGGNNYGNGSGGQGDGFIFSFNSSGHFSLLYSFDENKYHGYGPIGAMVQAANGSFYGITSSGGANNEGTIFQFTPPGSVSFPIWFNKGLGTQQSEQNSYNAGYYNQTVNPGLTKAGNVFYGTAPDGGGGNGDIFSLNAGANVAPAIVSQPFGGTFLAGSPLNLAVTASGTGTLRYQWYWQGSTSLPAGVTGGTTATLAFSSLAAGDDGSYYVVVSGSGSATSAVAVLSVEAPPSITTQPATNVTVLVDGTVNLSVAASGPGGLTYQWFFGSAQLMDGLATTGETITGSSTPNLSITQAQGSDSGSYTVVVSNPYGSTGSHVSVVTVGVGPGVSAPANVTAVLGQTGTLSVTPTAGTVPLHFQWEKVGSTTAIPNSTNATLILANVTASTAGSYFVVVTNRFGSITSQDAVVTVQSPPAIGTLPATIGLVQGGSTNLHVAATNGPFTWQWRRNITNLLVTTSNLTINPAYITNSGSYTVVVSNTYGGVTSGVCVVAVRADLTVPTNTITLPTNGARLYAPVGFTGQAFESHVPITNVNYWITNLNGSPILSGRAALAPGLGTASNWTVNISPYAGSNVFVVQCQNFSGTNSALVPLRFFLEAPAQLALATAGTGSGTFTGTASVRGDSVPATNAPLNVGEGYTITAIPGSNTYFVNWTGTVPTSTNPTLSFVMQENTSLTATFVTNIFPQMAGTYNGLFTNATFGVTEETAGLLHVALRPDGSYSGTITMGGTPISGTSLGQPPESFTHSGNATNKVLVSPYGGLTVTLQVVANSSPRTITGQVIGTNIIAFDGVQTHGWTNDFALIASLTNSSFDAAVYNFLIPPTAAPGLANAAAPNTGGDVSTWYGAGVTAVTIVATAAQGGVSGNEPPVDTGGATTSTTADADAARLGASRLSGSASTFTLAEPPGYGYGLLAVNPTNANVTLTGALADGTPFSQTVNVGEDNGIPVFIAPYTSPNNGIVIGELSLSNTPDASAPSGNLTWIRKGAATGLFRAGFTNTPLLVQGSFWSNSVPFVSLYFPIVLTGGGLTNSPVSLNATLSRTNLVGAGGNIIGNINTNTGLFTITFTNAGAQTARGAFLQNVQSGNGFFVLPSSPNSPTNAGSVSISSQVLVQPARPR